ncbi:MAG: cytochrome c [Acidobacteriota bacterium]
MRFKPPLRRRVGSPGKSISPPAARDRRLLWCSWGCLLVAAVMALLAAHRVPLLARPGSSQLKLDTGKEIYVAGCVSCHGPDGKGQSQNLTGFERPSTFPDFTDCYTATREPDLQWRAIITEGGPARAFSEIMPAFGDALTQEQFGKVIEYLRSLCT